MTFIDPTGHDSAIPPRDFDWDELERLDPDTDWDDIKDRWNDWWDSIYGGSADVDTIVDQFTQDLTDIGFTDIQVVDFNEKKIYATFNDPERGKLEYEFTFPGNGDTFAGVREIVNEGYSDTSVSVGFGVAITVGLVRDNKTGRAYAYIGGGVGIATPSVNICHSITGGITPGSVSEVGQLTAPFITVSGGKDRKTGEESSVFGTALPIGVGATYTWVYVTK